MYSSISFTSVRLHFARKISFESTKGLLWYLLSVKWGFGFMSIKQVLLTEKVEVLDLMELQYWSVGDSYQWPVSLYEWRCCANSLKNCLKLSEQLQSKSADFNFGVAKCVGRSVTRVKTRCDDCQTSSLLLLPENCEINENETVTCQLLLPQTCLMADIRHNTVLLFVMSNFYSTRTNRLNKNNQKIHKL